MEAWVWTTSLLCLYGFLKDFKPSEPFLTQYLIEPQWVNITLEEAYQHVYPVWTYSYLAVLVAVFLLTDFARYKPVIVFEGFAYIATWILLLWGHGVGQMQLMQVTYGIATSTEVAYYTYIYAKVDPKHYQRVTSFTRGAILLGLFSSGVLAQVLTSTGLLDFRQLNVISLVSVTLATIVAFCLPPVQSSIYFHNQESKSEQEQIEPLTTGQSGRSKIALALVKLKSDFVDAFGNGYVLKWSVWWALGMCGNYQVGNFIQPLWESVHPMAQHDESELYNGAVEAASTLAGAILTFAFAYVRLNWALIGELVLFLISAMDGLVLVWMGLTTHIWVAYIGYLAYRSLFQMLITVASYEVARNIKADSYGLVFGVNTFLALLFQTILTLIVVEMLALEPRTQFVVYGGICICIGLLYLTIFVWTRIRHGISGFVNQCLSEGLWLPSQDQTETTEEELSRKA